MYDMQVGRNEGVECGRSLQAVAAYGNLPPRPYLLCYRSTRTFVFCGEGGMKEGREEHGLGDWGLGDWGIGDWMVE